MKIIAVIPARAGSKGLKNKKKVKIKNLYYNQNFKNLNKILGRIFLINKDKLVKKKFYDQIK